jgi:hypothetical protein
MAQSTVPKTSAYVAKTQSGGTPTILYIAEGRAAARSWPTGQYIPGKATASSNSVGAFPMAGCFVHLNASRAMESWKGDSNATVYDVDETRMLGLLLESCNGTTTHKCAVAIGDRNNMFCCSVVSETATTTATTTATLAGLRMQGSVTGSRFYLDRTASGLPLTSIAAGPNFRVLEVVDPEGAYNGRVIFQTVQSLYIYT